MILSALRKQLRGWLQDTTTGGIQWTNQQLDRNINLALRETEKHVLQYDPEAFKCTYKANTTVAATGADAVYSWPAGTVAVHEVGLSSDGVSYSPLARYDLKTTRQSAAGLIGSLDPGFVPYDARHFLLWPRPSVAVTNGLRVIVAPTLVMADDNDASPIPHQFETLNLKHAQLFCLWDVGEPTKTLQDEIDEMKKETPRFWLSQLSTEPPMIQPFGGLDRGY
jgi:hypothetical protein